MSLIFHQLATERGCQSYLLGCARTRQSILIDPEISLMERYQTLSQHHELVIHYLLDTHTHADHFSATRELAERMQLPIIMHRNSTAPFVSMRVDDGETLLVGDLRLKILYTPGHTADSICIHVDDRVFTGDTLLIGGTGRTDLPTGNAEQLYDSLFNKLLLLPRDTRVYPAHIYSQREYSTIGEELDNNPRLQKKSKPEFVELMQTLNLDMPTHLTEALRTNLSGGKTIEQLINEAASKVSFMSMEEVQHRLQQKNKDFILLDVRERDAYEAGHIPGATLLPRGQLELRVNTMLPDPTTRIVVYCELGKISTLAAATLRNIGFNRAVALDGGMKAWVEHGLPVQKGDQ